MKRLLILLISTLLFVSFINSKQPSLIDTDHPNENGLHQLARVIKNDSILRIISNNKCIILYLGERTKYWSVVYDTTSTNAENPSFLCGETNVWGSLISPIGFDIVSFQNNNKETIKWGMDSLQNQSSALKVVPSRKPAKWGNFNLIVVDKGKIVFSYDSSLIKKYKGRGSKEFNQNRRRLTSLMLHLALHNLTNHTQPNDSDTYDN